MRISDWSSDVRSSDLHVERQQPGEFLGVDGRNRGQAAQRRRVQHQYVQRLPAVRNGMGQPPDAFAVDQVRSEEHTSELQSLMRISYAVFCMKKKTLITHTPVQKLNLHATVGRDND